MATREEILERLKKVMDPELGQSIVDLGMVKQVELDGPLAKVRIDVTIEACPLKDQIRREVIEAVTAVDASLKVQLTMGAMTPAELDMLKKRLGAQRSAAIGSGQPASTGTEGKITGDAGGINRLKKKVPHVIAVGSGKGGVGKSSVTAQLACALVREGYPTGILDADITGPSIARIFGATDRPLVKEDEKDVMIPVSTQAGVNVLSMNLLLSDEKSPVIWRGPLINGAIRQLYANAAWEGCEFLLIDMPPGTSDATLTIYQSLPLDGVVIVTTPQSLVGMIVAKSIKMAQSLRIKVLGLVENLAYVQVPERKDPYYVFGALKGQAAADDFKVPYWGALALDPAVAEACDKGQIHTVDNPQFRGFAKQLVASVAKVAVKV